MLNFNHFIEQNFGLASGNQNIPALLSTLKHFLLFLLFGACCAYHNEAYADNPIKISVEQIFTNPNEVYTICKDAKGIIWLGTATGLMIYDGYETIPIPELQNISVVDMTYDAVNDRIWAITENNIYLISCNNIKVKKITYPFSDNDVINNIYFNNKSKQLYCATSDGVIYVIDKHENIQNIIHTNIHLSKMVSISNGDIFMTQKGKLYKYSYANKNLKLLTCPYVKGITSNGLAQSGDTILATTWYNGVQLIDGKTTKNITPKLLNNINHGNSRASVAALSNGNLFTAYSNYSFFIIDFKNNVELNISKEYGKIFNGRFYNCILVASGNTVFVGTSTGLIKINLQKKIFDQLLSGNTPTISTRNIYKTSDGLYVASYSGILHYNDQNKQWQNINKTLNGNDQYILPYAMLDYGNYLYAVLESKFLYRYDKHQHLISKDFYKKSADSLNGLENGYCLVGDDNGTVWIGTKKGIASYDTISNTLDYHRTDQFYLNGATVKSLYFDQKKQELLAATNNGLYSLSINSHQSKLIWSYTNAKNKNNNLLFTTLDAENNIWIGTYGSGIYIIYQKTRQVKHITTLDGLSDNIVYSILFDDDKKSAWISTYNGLSNYKIDKNTFSNYFEEDGLSNNEFNHNSYYNDQHGTFYFGGIDGINVLHPDQFDNTEKPFELYISAVKKWDIKKGNEITIPFNNQYEIVKKPSDITLGIMLGISDYKHPERTTFLYKIKGLNANWIQLKKPHILRLDGLPYGKYDVTIKALNYRGQASDNMLHLSVVLEAPYYYRWWFIMTIILTLGLITYAIIKYKIEEYKKYQQLRVQIASDLHDEVGSILTSIGMYSENLKNNQESLQKKQLKIDKIANLSRNAIVSMRDILWAIDARNDLTNNFVEHIRNHAEELLLPQNINIHFEIKIEASQKQLDGNIRHQLYFIFKEAINNITKHSNATDVYIKFILDHSHINIQITNNGVINKKDDKKGQGLRNMKLRAEKIDANFEWTIQSNEFTIIINR